MTIPHWSSSLSKLAAELTQRRISDVMQENAGTITQQALGITIDFTKNKLTQNVLELLLEQAQQSTLKHSIAAMFSGEKINQTEQRAVLHTLLRAQQSPLAEFSAVQSAREKAAQFSDKVRAGKLLGATGKPINTIVNIGIGGSDLGPKLLLEAFAAEIPSTLSVHCLSDVDYAHAQALLASLDLSQTLFILCSKSFTTWETQTNAKLVIEQLKQKVSEAQWAKHFAGVAVDQAAMTQFGILPEHQFCIWDFVGGRYSVWSAVGLIARIALGNATFERFLAGAAEMDEHFQQADFAENLPVLLALVQIWNINYLGHDVFITLPYHHSLARFPDYQQQLEMESNGKAVNQAGEFLSFATCPYIFGQLGLNAQHAFMQLVHQSQHKSYLEFIAVPDPSVSFADDVAYRSCLAQSRALMTGTDGVSNEKTCPGDRPSTTLVLEAMTPQMLGKLLALYEHKVFVQSVLWGINAFDQFGVELGKKIATSLTESGADDADLDVSTRALIDMHQ
ncbi:MAG: glucose-6-phosphate isomerase [Gammaproteobacteria bacterium]|nr:glucose-6-phosphate isomerase [Gammaproteobacteria bacterium]